LIDPKRAGSAIDLVKH